MDEPDNIKKLLGMLPKDHPLREIVGDILQERTKRDEVFDREVMTYNELLFKQRQEAQDVALDESDLHCYNHAKCEVEMNAVENAMGLPDSVEALFLRHTAELIMHKAEACVRVEKDRDEFRKQQEDNESS